MTEKPSRTRKWLLLAIKVLIVVVVLWAVRRTIFDAWSQLGDHRWRFEPLWLVAAGALYLVGLLPAGLFWHRVLRVMGQDAGLGETLRAYFIGHLGKYVPGKAMVVILRTGLIRSHRVNTGLAAASVFFETLTMMSVGAFLAAAVLAFSFRDYTRPLVGAVGLMVVAGLPTVPPIFRRLAKLARVGRSDPDIDAKLRRLGPGTLLVGWLAMTVVWVMLGLSYWATLRAMAIPGLDPIGQLPRYTASVALAMVAGFLLLVLPGGIGVREAALVELIHGHLETLTPDPELAAWASAAMLRLVWLVAEILVSIILYIGLRRRKTAAPSPESPESP